MTASGASFPKKATTREELKEPKGGEREQEREREKERDRERERDGERERDKERKEKRGFFRGGEE